MYTKEQIIEEIKRIAARKGEQTLNQEDFQQYSTIPMSTVRYYLGTWKLALQEAGVGAVITPNVMTKIVPENEDELLLDLIRLNKETGEIPTPALIEARGKYYLRYYLAQWKSINEAYIQAQKKFPPKPFSLQQQIESFPSTQLIEPAEILLNQKENSIPKSAPRTLPEEFSTSLRFMTEPHLSIAEIPIESLELTNYPELEGKSFFFRGLTNAPVNKIGVIYLFGTIHRELGYSIDTFLPGYPDCKGERCLDRPNNRWETVNICFEYKSSDFQFYHRNENADNVIVCWLHDQQRCSHEVLELCTTIKQLPSQ